MLRSLLTRLSGALLICMLSWSAMSAQTMDYADCECSLDGEHFEQTISLTSMPSEIWTFVSSTNFYSAVNPYTPFIPGSLISEVPLNSGNYVITGFRISGGASSITLMRDMEEFVFEFPDECTYPSVSGDSFVCEESGPQTYSAVGFDAPVTWVVPPAVPVLSPMPDLILDWSMVPVGTYTIQAMGTYTVGMTSCMATLDFEIEVSANNIADQIACNNTVQLSLNGICELEVLADMILEGDDINNDAYTVTITTTEGGEPLTDQMVTQEYLGMPLIVTVRQECGGNACWGTLIVEDKSAPPLTCPDDVTLSCEDSADPDISGLPVPMGVTAVLQPDGTYLLEDFDFCGDAILMFHDELVDNSLCEGPFGAIIERIWTVTDNAGNTSTCSQLISVERADLNQVIVWPPNWDDVLPGGNPSLIACDDWPALDNGYPDPDFTGVPLGVFCANVEVSYEDTHLEKCGTESYKIIRRWTVRDICGDADDVLIHNQYITVKDDTPPVFKTMDDGMEVEATGHNCASDIVVPEPELLLPECSEWSYTVGYKLLDESGDPFDGFITDGVVFDNQLGLYVIENIEAVQDTVWIVYVLEDACGNVSTGATEVVVIDKEQPVPVCDLHTHVGLNQYGVAHAGVSTFDDGSWDNCSISHMEVRRMDGDPCGEGTADFSDNVHFCCDDIGTDVLVELRVIDHAGNTNECWVTVTVQDNIAPQLVSCPGPRTIDCDVDIDNLGLYGSPVFEDECGFTVTHEDVLISSEDCGLGTRIRRTFTATDGGDNTAICIQILTLNDNDPFEYNDIDWPNDLDMHDGCVGADLDPANLPNCCDTPDYDEGPCDMLAESYNDVIFYNVDDVCMKVLRKWTVINNCTHESWTWTQTIKVTNSEGPQVTCDDIQITDGDLSDCEKNVFIRPSATDDCTPDSKLIWTYRVDGGPIRNGNELSASFEGGEHGVVWFVEDECGNVGICTSVFTIEDTKNPTPICLENIITTINDDGLTSQIWASDFIKEVLDNCSDPEDITLSFEPDFVSTYLEFTCEDIMTGTSDTIPVEIYITDEAGNQEYCGSNLILQDNLNVCGNANDDDDDGDNGDDNDDGDSGDDDGDGDDEETRVAIAGQVYSESDILMPEVEISLNAEMAGFPLTLMSDAEGAYAFEDMEMYMDYNLAAHYEGSYLEGVSTLDLVLIQKHILGSSVLDSPYKIIAADANSSESVTAVDLIELRKLILGIYLELPQNSAWRFVDAGFQFSDPYAPFPYEENVELYSLDHDEMEKDFVAVKIGDVNNTVSIAGDDTVDSRSQQFVNWTIENQSFKTNQKIEVDVIADGDYTLEGFQVAYHFNHLNVDAVVPGSLIVTEGQVYAADKKLRISWNEELPVDIKKGETLFTVIATMDGSGSLANEFVQGNALKAQAYTNDSGEIQINELNTIVRADKAEGFVLYQNVPNPFSDVTNVSFSLPKAQNVNLTVADYTGRVVFRLSGQYEAGLNRIELDANAISGSGLLHLTLETEDFTGSQRILVLK